MKLLPCPFCGGEAEFERTGTRQQSCIVACTECGGKLESPDEYERSGTAWNRRNQTPKKLSKLEFGSYSGGYPNLCSGQLVLLLDGSPVVFPWYCMESGGGVWFDDDYDEHINSGEWSISDWPEGFPDELHAEAIRLVNEHVPHGCCGGCV